MIPHFFFFATEYTENMEISSLLTAEKAVSLNNQWTGELIGWDRSAAFGTSFGLTEFIAPGCCLIKQKQTNSGDVFTNSNFSQIKLALVLFYVNLIYVS